MNHETDQRLLQEYAERQSQAAFAEVVRRYVDLVFSAARRLTVDLHLAEDVTQNVFVALAREAEAVSRKLEAGMPLSGWLHVTTRHLALSTIRAEQRRRDRELKAVAMDDITAVPAEDALWDPVAPHLDPALAELNEADRHAILLRYFERKSAREIGERFGWTEEAAQKRLHRALDRLRGVLVARGLAVPSASLASVLTAKAVQVAPAGLSGSIATGVAALVLPATTTTSSSLGLLSLMTATPAKIALTTLAVAALSGVWLLQHREIRRLESEVAQLRQSPPAAVAVLDGVPAAPDPGASQELLRLRGEVAALKRTSAEVDSLRRENARLRARNPGTEATATAAADSIEEQKRMGIARLNYAKGWGLALFKYAMEHNEQYPPSLEEASTFFESVDDNVGLTPDQFELLYRGSIAALRDPSRTIILREKQPFASANPERPGWSRTYLFADGHSEIRHSANGDFQDFEQERLPSASESAPPPPLTIGAGAAR